jgi:hypothetical protein
MHRIILWRGVLVPLQSPSSRAALGGMEFRLLADVAAGVVEKYAVLELFKLEYCHGHANSLAR